MDVNALALGSSSVFFLLIFLCLTVPLSDFPPGSSVNPLVIEQAISGRKYFEASELYSFQKYHMNVLRRSEKIA